MFGIVLTSIITVMHLYVFYRIASVPFVRKYASGKVIIVAGICFWFVFWLGRVLGHGSTGGFAAAMEFLGMNWMATLFLICVAVLLIDIITAFGFIMPKIAPVLRGWAVAAGLILSTVALVQGMRPPVIQRYDVSIPKLPKALDKTVLVAMSDLHLGPLIGTKWLAARVAQVRQRSLM